MTTHENTQWYQDPKYDGLNDPRLNTWLDTGRMLSELEEKGRPLPDQLHKAETIIKVLAETELARLKPKNW